MQTGKGRSAGQKETPMVFKETIQNTCHPVTCSNHVALPNIMGGPGSSTIILMFLGSSICYQYVVCIILYVSYACIKKFATALPSLSYFQPCLLYHFLNMHTEDKKKFKLHLPRNVKIYEVFGDISFITPQLSLVPVFLRA